jgi:uncharacterized protein
MVRSRLSLFRLSFPRKRESRACGDAVAPASSAGQALDSRFRGNDNLSVSRAANSCLGLIVAVILLAPATPAWAQAKDPVALAKAKELLAISDLATMRDQMVHLVEAQIAALVLEANPGEKAAVDRAVAELVRPSLKRRMPEYIDLAAGIYAEHFTRGELDQLLAFYKSPIGQKLKREQGKLVPAISEMARNWVNRVGNEVLKDASQGLLKRGLQPPGA